MPDNEKKHGVLSIFKGVFKYKKEECEDIVIQAEKVIADYINKRRNEIVGKYCKKKSRLANVAWGVFVFAGLYVLYRIIM